MATPAPAAEKTDLTGVETSIKDLASTLESQTVTLGEIKTVVATPPAPEKVDLTGLETSVKSVISTLESQSSTLAEIKTTVRITYWMPLVIL